MSRKVFISVLGFSNYGECIYTKDNYKSSSVRFIQEATLDYLCQTENWTEKDGWYYYNEALQPGESTKPLFTTVVFAPSMDNLYRNAQATVVVDVEATQFVHNGQSALEAAGWPDAEGGNNA